MRKPHYRLLLSLAALAACKFSPNVKDGQIHCASPTECPSGYTCVTGGSTSALGVCCKDKACQSGLLSSQDGGDADGPMASPDGPASDLRPGDAWSDSTVRDGAADLPQDSIADVPYVADAGHDIAILVTGGTTAVGRGGGRDS